MRHIRKEFPGVVANDDISITLKKGEILAILGENGAGKSTLMSILFGMYRPESGSILINGKEVHISNPNVATALGISMVHQHFKLVHNFTVTENIILGQEPTRYTVLNRKSAADRVRQISEKYGLNVDPNAKIEDISVGMQQRVEILKMLYRDADILIFDEPTAVLMPQEIQELIAIMKNLVKEGKSIILITHKLNEIKAVADRCTVIRAGKLVGTVDVKETSTAKMAEMMVGRPVSFKVDKKDLEPGEPVLSVRDLNVMSNRKVLGLKNFSIDVRAGEILGIAGVDGNGQSELVEAITGLRNVESGSIHFNGTDITREKVRQRVRQGMAHIPEDRQKRGLVLDYTLEDNLVLELYDQKPFAERGLLNRDEIRAHAEVIIRDFDVRAGLGSQTIVGSMSGGNQQKAIIGREIGLHPNLLIAVQPTRGLDVGSIEYIHKRIVEQRDNGKAVLMVSLELEEVLNLSDRIAVVCNGELIGILNADEADEKMIGLMMAGVKGGHES